VFRRYDFGIEEVHCDEDVHVWCWGGLCVVLRFVCGFEDIRCDVGRFVCGIEEVLMWW
jgi:hypothetical protein